MNWLKPSSMAMGALALWVMSAIANAAEHAEPPRQANGKAAASAGHSLAATGRLVSGVVAIPFLASGEAAADIGSSALHAGGASMKAASSPAGKPLPITDENLSILPPNKALQQPLAPKN